MNLVGPATSATYPAPRSNQSIHACREALAAWLLDGNVQIATGEHRGAVAGVLGDNGRARYVYPEITGYYLQWLSWRTRIWGATRDLSARAMAAQGWLLRWVDGNDWPPTRVYLDGKTADWRNAALFFFDVAMVLRGLAWAVEAGLVRPDLRLVTRLSALLERMIGSDGIFETVLRRDGGTPLPARWSTRRGPFLAKAAQGVMFAARRLPGLSANVTSAAAATFEASLQWIVDGQHRETHPLLYSIEGVLNASGGAFDAHPAAHMERQFRSLLTAGDGAGHLPESAIEPGAHRLDIVAQALRVGIVMLLQSPLRRRPGDHDALDRLQHLLVRSITRTGGMPFAVGARPLQLNAWTTMFAEQSLGMWQSHVEGAHPIASGCLI